MDILATNVEKNIYLCQQKSSVLVNHLKNKKMSRKFTFLASLFTVCLIASNLFEIKIFQGLVWPFGNHPSLPLTGGFLIFPISYILNDCLTEVYGLKNARLVIWMAFLMNLSVVGMAQVVRILPSAEFWNGQAHFDYIFAADLRITAASMAAFLLGSLVNARVMSRMKVFQGENGFGWRAVVSSLAGESIDSVVFFPIAFWGVGFRHMLVMMLTQIVLKTLYEVLVLPLTSLFVKRLKLTDGPSQE